MKLPMYEKESKNKKYRDDPYRAVNFRVNEEGRLVCPNNKEFFFLTTEPVKETNMGEPWNFTNAKIAVAVLTDPNATRVSLTILFG